MKDEPKTLLELIEQLRTDGILGGSTINGAFQTFNHHLSGKCTCDAKPIKINFIRAGKIKRYFWYNKEYKKIAEQAQAHLRGIPFTKDKAKQEKAKQMLKDGYTYKQIGDELGYSESYMSTALA